MQSPFLRTRACDVLWLTTRFNLSRDAKPLFTRRILARHYHLWSFNLSRDAKPLFTQ